MNSRKSSEKVTCNALSDSMWRVDDHIGKVKSLGFFSTLSWPSSIPTIINKRVNEPIALNNAIFTFHAYLFVSLHTDISNRRDCYPATATVREIESDLKMKIHSLLKYCIVPCKMKDRKRHDLSRRHGGGLLLATCHLPNSHLPIHYNRGELTV